MADNLADILVELHRRLFEVERRLANHRRTGVIDEIDHGKGVARVKIEEGEQPFRTGWIPWKEIAAGGISTHIPPTVGQQVDVMSESGDLTDAVIDFSTHSNANPRPHDGPDAVIVKGGVRFFISDDTVTIDAANITFYSFQRKPCLMPLIDRLGDTSSHGGTVISSADKWICEGKLIARKGDLHSCPIPGHGVTPIVSGSSKFICEGDPVARTGDTTGCGASLISGATKWSCD